MKPLLYAAFAAATLVSACESSPGPPMSISNLVVLEPLPGSGVAVAYLELHNRSDSPIAIVKIHSPEFSRIEMHETVVENDVARMRSLSTVPVDAHSSTVFSSGGKHLMLFDAAETVAAGTPVTLEFGDDANGLISVTTKVRSRADFPE